MNIDKKSLQPYLHRKKVLAQAEHVLDAHTLGSGLKNVVYVVDSEDRLTTNQRGTAASSRARSARSSEPRLVAPPRNGWTDNDRCV